MIETKQCKNCDIIKHIDYFSKDSNGKFGLKARCKECINIKTSNYYKTKNGLIHRIFNNQIHTSKRRSHNPPSYTLKELKSWLYSQPLFHELYDNWKRLDYQKDYIPSVDRKDDYVRYTISNIQIMTWKENLDKYYLHSYNGINNKNNNKVFQYTKKGVFVKEYHSLRSASRETGIDASNISKCRKGKIKYAGGFQWL